MIRKNPGIKKLGSKHQVETGSEKQIHLGLEATSSMDPCVGSSPGGG